MSQSIRPLAHLPSPPGHRIGSLESIRAIAALQVLLLHLFTAFIPAIVFDSAGGAGLGDRIHGSFLFYFYDGHSAVYVFFVLSGYVLTAPFARDGDQPLRVLASRGVRLAVPVIAAGLFAALLMAIWPRAHIEAGHAAGSDWLANHWLVSPGFWNFWRDAVVNALFVGYREDGSLVALGLHPMWLQGFAASYDDPLWTLSIEFFGSILVLALVQVRHHLPRAWLVVLLIVTLLVGRTAYVCFAIGHLTAVMTLAKRPSRVPGVACILGLTVGIFLCASAEHVYFGSFGEACAASVWWLLPCDDPMRFQKRVGALLVFFSIISWEEAKWALSSPRLAILGRLSFPVYLVHWPIVFSFCSFIYLVVLPIGSAIASAVAIAAGLGATLSVALGFMRVDTAAQELSRSLRRRRIDLEATAKPPRV